MRTHITVTIYGSSSTEFEFFSSHDSSDRDRWIRALNAIPAIDNDGLISIAIESDDGCKQSIADLPLSYSRTALIELTDLLIQDIAAYECSEKSFKPAHTRALCDCLVTGGWKATPSPSTPGQIHSDKHL